MNSAIKTQIARAAGHPIRATLDWVPVYGIALSFLVDGLSLTFALLISGIGALILKLSNILQVDFAYSKAGRSADSLKAAVGTLHAEVFDFEAMSRMLGKSAPDAALPVGRHRRIEQLLAVLKSQRFFGAPRGTGYGPESLSSA